MKFVEYSDIEVEVFDRHQVECRQIANLLFFKTHVLSLSFSFVFVTVWSGLRLSLVSVLYVDTVSTQCLQSVVDGMEKNLLAACHDRGS